MCYLLEIRVHSRLSANPGAIPASIAPTMLFSPGHAPLARASPLRRCWAAVLAATPAREGISAGGGSAATAKAGAEKRSQASRAAVGPFSPSGFLFPAPCLAGAALPGAPTMLAGPAVLPSGPGTSGAN